MKERSIVFLLCLATSVVQGSTVTARAVDFTCQVYGGSFVLDDSDFKALEEGSLTREKFAALEATSKTRAVICATRKLSRLVRDGKADACAFDHYPNHAPMYLGDSEIPAYTKALANASLGKKCQQ